MNRHPGKTFNETLRPKKRKRIRRIRKALGFDKTDSWRKTVREIYLVVYIYIVRAKRGRERGLQ